MGEFTRSPRKALLSDPGALIVSPPLPPTPPTCRTLQGTGAFGPALSRGVHRATVGGLRAGARPLPSRPVDSLERGCVTQSEKGKVNLWRICWTGGDKLGAKTDNIVIFGDKNGLIFVTFSDSVCLEK